VVSKALGAEISLTVEELMKLSPSVRDELKSKLGSRFTALQAEANEYLSADDLPNQVQTFLAKELPRNERPTVPDEGAIALDVVIQYHQGLTPDQEPRKIVVSKESQALKVVFPRINGVAEEECVCDTGSQIVSMSEAAARQLQLTYDPDITIYMQSANGESEKTLGVAKNVPFTFGDVTVYLQVHIVRDPAYRVLLGRPFDVLTKSEIKTEENGSTNITITCPNTKRRRTINAYDRGRPRLVPPKSLNEGFSTSRS
jgi:hypothetical protein